MQLFDDEWLVAAADALAGLPAVEGADAVIDYVIGGAPGGKLTISVAVIGGRVSAITAGRSSDPDLVISLGYDAAAAIVSGVATSEAGYMNGTLKVEGAHARWMLDLRSTRLAAIEALAPVMANTDI